MLGACRDLALPDVQADGGPGPDLTVLAPREGQTIPLNAAVNIQAVSVNGVAAVTVTCGGAPSTGVFTWNVPPYTGVVDFTRCSLVTNGATDAGFGQLQLTFIAADRQGRTSTKSFNVLLDTTTAALSAILPQRVVPTSQLDLTVGSDRPLLLPPTVRLAGREADGVRQRANPDGGAPFYDVTFLRTPGLGIDTYAGDPYAVPFEVLTDVERSVSLTVDARATNGNASHLEQGVLLSRVLWDRAVPGRIAISAADAVATAAGVQVPLATKDAVPGPTAPWLPGFFRAPDGIYVPFDPPNVRVVGPSLPSGPVTADAGTQFPPDAGYFATELDGRGRVLMARPSIVQRGGSDIIALAEPSGGIRAAASYTVQFPLVAPLTDGGVLGQTLTRVDDLLCLPDAFTGSNDGCWYAIPTATQTLRCFTLADGSQTTAVGTSTTIPLGPPNPGGTAGAHGSPRTYIAPNDVASCGPAWTLMALPGNVFVPQQRTDPVFGTGCFAASSAPVNRVLPFPDGSYALLFDVNCPTGQGWEVVKVSATGAVTGSYLAPQGVFLPDPTLAAPPLILGALADGRVVTMRNEPPNTVFEAWPANGAGPTATARVPGLYVYLTPVPRLGRNVAAATDGSLTVLLNSATFGDVVLHFGPGLTPRWLYRYPLLATSSTLVAADGETSVYYVDPLNNVLVALDTRGGSSGGTGCVVNGVSVAASPNSLAPGGTSSLTATVSSSGTCSTGVSWSASPAGGTVTPNGNSATFTSSTPGTYTVTATSVADPTRSGSTTVTVTGAASCAAPSGTVVTHSTNIAANETWAGNGVTHSVPNAISINAPATVTIQPCAYVSLGAGVSISVNTGASLVAAGTGPAGSISFAPANATQPWGILRGLGSPSLIDLSWTTLEGAGAFGGTYGNPAIAVAGPGYSVAPAVPVLRVNNVTIDTPQGGGVYLDTSAAFTTDSTGLTIQGASGYVLSMVMMSLGSVPPGSYASPTNALPMVNVIGPNANVIADLTIHATLPVRIQTGSLTVRAPTGTNPVTLTIEPGAVLRFPKVAATSPGARVYFGSTGNAPNDVVGVLNAQGTATQPILFTSGEPTPAAGDWAGVYLLAATGSRLDHVTVEYAGAFSGIVSTNCRPGSTPDDAALIIGDATQYVPPSNLLTNSTVRFSAGYAIDAVWQAPTRNAPDLSATNVFQNNARCAQTFNALSTGTCGTNLGCTAP
jgi:hypothetical protein